MSKISISVASPTTDDAATNFLHQQLGWGISNSSKMLAMGKAAVFFTCQLYLSDHNKKAKTIKKIISFFQKQHIDLCIIKIAASEDWNNIDMLNSRHLEISGSDLIQLLEPPK